MPKKSELPLTKKTLNFFDGDCETIADAYPMIGHSMAIRQLVHVHAKKLRERASRSGTQAHDRAEIAALANDITLGDLEQSIADTGDSRDA